MSYIRNATSHISQGCNNLIRITWGCNNVCRIKSRTENLHEIEYLVFHNYFVFFGKKYIFSGSHVFRSDQFSLLMYCLLPSSATVKMDLYEENMEKARYATNDDTPLRTKD
jgi:hypothetical protein